MAQEITVKRIPALPVGANAAAGYKIAVWNSLTDTTEQFDVSEFLNQTQSGNYDWVQTTTYNISDVVFYDNKLWASLTNGNVGNVPQTGPNWVEVVEGQSSGLKNWAPGAYPADEVFVVYDDGAGNNLYELVNPVRPYLSVDIDAEILAGDWEPFSLSVSDIPFDGARAIKALPLLGQNTGTTSTNDFLDAIFFPEQVQSISINNQPVLEVGVLHVPNIIGQITPKDAIISARRVREVISNQVIANPATDAVNENDAATTMIEGTTKTYRIEADSDLALNVNSVNKNLIGVYPYLTGFGAAGLTGNPLYAALNKLIQQVGTKTISFTGTNQKQYICFPASYPDLSSIKDPNGFEILGAAFPSTPTIADVTANGLANDWTESYKIYETVSNTSANGNYTITH